MTPEEQQVRDQLNESRHALVDMLEEEIRKCQSAIDFGKEHACMMTADQRDALERVMIPEVEKVKATLDACASKIRRGIV